MSSEKVNDGIKKVISELMDRVMDKVLIKDPFIKEKHHSKKPLYAALVPDEIFKGSHFERRFVTPFGGVWEKLARVVAQEYHGHCEMGKTITGEVGAERLRRIQEVLNKLEHKKKGKDRIIPDWDVELKYILAGKGTPIPTSVVCDIYIESERTNKKYAFMLEASLPNRTQSKLNQEKVLKLFAMIPMKVNFTSYALVDDFYRQKKHPSHYSKMFHNELIIIGSDFWNLIGGKGTYDKLTSEINSLGGEYHKRIYQEYLGIEPPLK